MTDTQTTGAADRSGGLLDLIEWIGNKLPDPSTLFLLGTILVMVLSHIAYVNDWSVQRQLPEPVMVEQIGDDGVARMAPQRDPETNEVLIEWVATDEINRAKSLLTRDGLYWALSNLVDNFMGFAPLGVVLVGMLGIGVAERTGLLGACLKAIMLVVPEFLFTPTMVFAGIMSSMALDAGYVVLPPLAAALYKSVGRSPLVGIAAVFAGVSAGFNANLFITGLDPMLAELANTGTTVIDPNYFVNPACNWYFMIASTVVMTFVGWGVTAWFVERRFNQKSPDDGGPLPASAADLEKQRLTPQEKRGLAVAGVTFLVVFGIVLAAIVIDGWALHTYKAPDTQDAVPPGVIVELQTGDTIPEFAASANAPSYEDDGRVFFDSAKGFDRWVEAIVPILFFLFITPAIAFGVYMKEIRNDKDLAKLLIDSMAYMAPIIVLAFFAAQFIEHFKYSGLDRMLALSGGQALGQAGLSPYTLIVAFIGVTILFNMFIGSMSAKYAMFAPIFIPMFMLVGISPELTQAAYRIGDSVSNVITPLNAYLVIILVFMQKYMPKSGMGTLISMMLPYTIVFTIVWTVMLMIWMALEIPLGPGGPLWYDPVG
ncbi:MAG: AbgT family transporter [Phycisphaerales bacterium]